VGEVAVTDIPEGLVHRDTIVAGPGQTFTYQLPAWAKAARVIAKGGDAGHPDGRDGEGGYAIVELYGKPEERQ
jgi:hypothetical protein